ncbi:MAG: hypothetical protein Q7R62_01575 [bacterium]|nr:hypothetical protein [bacterium]
MKNSADQFVPEEIELILDSYDDIFSDFDPRPYHVRSLSHDFLLEAKRATYDKLTSEIVLKFIIPKRIRNVIHEVLIEKRLKQHFMKHFQEHSRELRSLKRTGLILVLFGALLMFFSYLLYSETLPLNTVLRHLLLVISEPGGWFLFWIGGEKFVYGVRDNRPDYEFYRKMSHSHITFNSIESEALSPEHN